MRERVGIGLSLLFFGSCGGTTPPVEPHANYLVEHRERQCADFAEEYASALRWCETSQPIMESSRQGSCLTARAHERDCLQMGTDSGVQVSDADIMHDAETLLDASIPDAGR